MIKDIKLRGRGKIGFFSSKISVYFRLQEGFGIRDDLYSKPKVAKARTGVLAE